MELKRVVVTGLGAISPLGNDVATTWENAKAGVSGAGPITHFDASLFKTQFACEVKGFKAEDHFDRRKARQLDLYAQYALVAARQAVADAGIEAEDGKNIDKNRVGVIVAAGIGGLHTFEEEAGYYALNADKGPKYNPFFIPKMIADIASGHISMEYGYHGPNYGVVSACASSNNAIIDAFNLIRLGKADVMITGGAEAAIFPAGVGGFTPSPPATTAPRPLRAPSARAATDSLWAKDPLCLCSKNSNTPLPAVLKSTARLPAAVFRPTLTTSQPPIPTASAPNSPCRTPSRTPA